MPNSNGKMRLVTTMPESESGKLRRYIIRHFIEEMGEEKFRKIHYLVRDTMMEEYEMEHQEELQKLFPNASL